MTPRGRTSRRGTALLIVLAVLVVVTSAAVVFAEVVSMEKLHGRYDTDSRNATSTLRAADAIVRDWLNTEADSIALPPPPEPPPPEANAPGISVVNERIAFDDQTVEVQITAWDQCGMVALESIHDGSPLRLTVPGSVLQAIDDIELDDRTPAGLDLVPRDHASAAARIFPKHPAGERVEYGHAELTAQAGSGQVATEGSMTRPPPAVGACVATHNPSQQINVNTAPLPVVERALLLAGRGGLEHIERQRRDGKPVALNQLPPAHRSNPQQSAPPLVGGSSSWSFRVDVRVGMAHSSWWMVYQRTGSRWECVQRLVIDE